MRYTYLNGSNVYIYPSANAEDGGNINKEVNIADLVNCIVPKDYIVSYKLRDPNIAHESLEVGYGSAELTGTEFYLYSGTVVLGGRRIDLTFDPEGTNFSKLSLNMLYDGDLRLASTLYLLVVPFFGASGNILGDSYQNVNGVVTRECKGVALTVVNSLTGLGLDHYVVVGTFTLVGGSITNYAADEESYKVFPDEKVKQNLSSAYDITSRRMILLSELDPTNGMTGETYYRPDVYITGTSNGKLHIGLPLGLGSQTPIYLDSYLYNKSELLVNSEGSVVTKPWCYISSTLGSTANKEIDLGRYTDLGSLGLTIKVQFRNSNTHTEPYLLYKTTSPANRFYAPIVLSDGSTCPSYAIKGNIIYDFMYDGNSWVLLNPSEEYSSGVHTAIYTVESTGRVNVRWIYSNKNIVATCYVLGSFTSDTNSYAQLNLDSGEGLPVPYRPAEIVDSATYVYSNPIPLTTGGTKYLSYITNPSNSFIQLRADGSSYPVTAQVGDCFVFNYLI